MENVYIDYLPPNPTEGAIALVLTGPYAGEYIACTPKYSGKHGIYSGNTKWVTTGSERHRALSNQAIQAAVGRYAAGVEGGKPYFNSSEMDDVTRKCVAYCSTLS